MSQVEVDKVIPQSGTTLTIGDSGDTINLVGTLQSNGSPLPGDISSVVAGTGLSGGGTTGAVTLNIEAAQPTITSLGTITSFRSTGIDDNATSTAITIDSSERVGLGRTPTNAPFEIQTLATDLLRFVGNNSQGDFMRSGWYKSDNSTNIAFLNVDGDTKLTFGTTTATPIQIYSNNSERLRITSAGLVGIGTTSPDGILHLDNGTNTKLVIEKNNGGYASLTFHNDGTSTSYIQLDASENMVHYGGSGVEQHFYSGGSERVRITSGGDVGIGETAPLGLFHVKSADSGASANSGHNQVIAENSGNSGMTILSGNTSNGAICFGDSGNNCIGYLNYTHNGNHLDFGVNGSEAMRILSSGNVGIKTSTPDAVLQVGALGQSGSDRGAVAIKTVANYTTFGQAGIYIEEASGSEGYYMGVDVSGGMFFNNSGAAGTTLYLADDDNVGIGETAPLGKLHVKTADTGASAVSSGAAELVIEGTGNVGMTIQSANDGTGNLYFGDVANGSVGRIAYAHSDNDMSFNTNGNEHMRLKSGGFLLIKATTTSLTNSAQVNFHSGSSEYGLRLNSTNTSGTQYHQSFDRGQTQAGYITSNSATTIAFNNASDERLKENIQNSNSAIQDIKDIQVRQFDWVDAIDTHRDFGFVAQELVNVVPEAVTQGTDELDDNGKPVRSWGVDYSHIVPRLVKAVQEQQTKIESLEARITTLENA